MKENREAVDRLRQELEHSRDALFGGQNPELLSALTAACPGLQRAFVVDWIPEQGENIYTVVASAGPTVQVIRIELDRTGRTAEPGVEVFSVPEYRRAHASLSKERRRKLELALHLVLQEPG